jgi:hypothetical protein
VGVNNMKLKELLKQYENDNYIFVIYGKNNLPFSIASAKCHLETSPSLLKYKVFFYDLGFGKDEMYVVINKKVRICK